MMELTDKNIVIAKINMLTLKQWCNPTVSRRNVKIKIRAEIRDIENR